MILRLPTSSRHRLTSAENQSSSQGSGCIHIREISSEPSGQDETTFARVFGKCNWALMFILAENNRTYAKLSFNVGPKGEILIPVEVDYSQAFGPSDHKLWDEEYQANVSHVAWLSDFDLFTGETAGLKDISGHVAGHMTSSASLRSWTL